MPSNFVIIDGEGWFEYTCTGCGAEIRFGPYNGEKGTDQFHQAQLKADDNLRSEQWSSTQKCLRCQAKRRARQALRVNASRNRVSNADRLALPILRAARKRVRLAQERYTTIDDELYRIAVYFQQLATELDVIAVTSSKHRQIWERVEAIRKDMEQLRRDLEQVKQSRE